MSKSFLNNHSVRGLRNNNPGNLIYTTIAWQGKIPKPQSKDAKFEQFTSITYGLRAMLKDLINDINKGQNTVRKLINEYAPKSENNTADYIKRVCNTIKVDPDEKITAINNDFLILLTRAILMVELGNAHKEVTDTDINEALQLLGDVSTKKLKVTITKGWKIFAPAILFVVFFF